MAFALTGDIYGLGFQKGSFLARFFSVRLLKLQDQGVLKGIFQKNEIPMTLCQAEEDNISLGIEKLVALLVIVLAGLILTLVVFLIELLFKRKNENNTSK